MGRRQGREPRRDDPRRRPGARRLRGRRADLRGLRGRDRAARPAGRAARRPRRRRHGRTGAARSRGPRAGRGPGDAGLDHRGDHRVLRPGVRGRPRRARCRPLLGDGRGHGVRLVRGHERDLPEHHRRGIGCRRGAPLLGVAVRRAHRLLPGQARLQPDRHRHRGGRPAPDPVHAFGRDVHDQPGERRPRRARDRGLVRPRRGRRVGERVAGPLRGRQAVAAHLRARHQGEGARDRVEAGRRHCHPGAGGRGAHASHARRRGGARARRAGPPDRAALRGGAGHRVGLRPPRQGVDAAVAAGDVRRRRRGRKRQGAAGRRADQGSRRGTRPRQRPGAGDRRAVGRNPLERGGRARHAHDRPRLGSADAQGRGDRDRFRRHDVSRRDRVARARDPLPGGHRRGDHAPARRRGRDRGRHARIGPRGRGGAAGRARAGGGRGCRPGDGDPPPGQPLRALPGRAGGGARRRRRRPAARGADGDRGARGGPPAHALGAEPRARVRGPHGRGADRVRLRVHAAPDHVPHDRLPHERVPRAGGRRPFRARGGEPDDRLPRGAPLRLRARRLRARAGGRAAGVGRRVLELP